MDYYQLEIAGISRKLPIVSLGPKIKIASLNLLGDTELVEGLSVELAKKLKHVDFDYLIGPEVKVVPLLHSLSKILKKKKYIVCRKNIHGYMVSPIRTKTINDLVIDGPDAKLIKSKKVVIIDDVVSSGKTISQVEELVNLAGAKVVSVYALFRQGNMTDEKMKSINFLSSLPVF